MKKNNSYYYALKAKHCRSIHSSNIISLSILFSHKITIYPTSISLFYRKKDLFFSCTFAGPKIVVRPEEAAIVIFVLVLWVGAIALFFNRWGKIRMLEPYQPKFQQEHRVSCPLIDLDPLSPVNHRASIAKMSLGMSTMPSSYVFPRRKPVS
jgi:hypothetical protein